MWHNTQQRQTATAHGDTATSTSTKLPLSATVRYQTIGFFLEVPLRSARMLHDHPTTIFTAPALKDVACPGRDVVRWR
eukprot:scaffold693_cov399-Prasinococcus_capsulatus_cf.AAC.27